MSGPSDTIFALASGALPAGIAVVRLSGRDALQIASYLLPAGLPKAGRFKYAKIIDPDSGNVIDLGLILYFAEHKSFTGESVVEFQIHGGRMIMTQLCIALEKLGARQAKAGEFSLRAVRNNKMSLAQAKSMNDHIHAESALAMRLAKKANEDDKSDICMDWISKLVDLLALVEASIDFADENISDEAIAQFIDLKNKLCIEIEKQLKAIDVQEKVKDGMRLCLVGRPNAGKSSLANALLRRQAVIVDNAPGTTRDALQFSMTIGDHKVILTDMAGLRETEDKIEKQGILIATRHVEEADRRLFLIPVDEMEDHSHWALVKTFSSPNDIVVITKTDISQTKTAKHSNIHDLAKKQDLVTNFITVRDEGQSLSPLSKAISKSLDLIVGTNLIATQFSSGWEKQKLSSIHNKLKNIDFTGRQEIIAHQLHDLINDLNMVSGRADVEILLDRIFSEFCIGK